MGRVAAFVQDYLPRGNTLDEETFRQRHLFLCWVLALHVPALYVLGVVRGYGPVHVGLEVLFPAACVAFARLSINRRLAAFFVTAGLVYCSSVLVHLSGGVIEAHFHFFILIGLIALYQDWVPFLWDVVFTVVSHGLGSAIGSTLMFNHPAAQRQPWTWALIHGVAVLAACIGVIIFWKNTEDAQARNVALVADLAGADARRREAVSRLLVNLARRNQSLIDRQLEVIGDLEQHERQPHMLEELFRLDHLATRIRRNAESLMVLSGDEPPRRWGTPVPLSDVVRAAAAEVEDYRRVDVLVDDHLDVIGRAVADLAHLLAELIENATTFSPPTSEVRVRSHLSPGDPVAFVITVEDIGVGMAEVELRDTNRLLAEVPEVDVQRATTLGFHVVARLAQRYGIAVHLAGTPGGGLTAVISLPSELLSERPAGAAPAAGEYGRDQRYQQAARAWTGTRSGRPVTNGVPDRWGRTAARRLVLDPAARPPVTPSPEAAPPAPPVAPAAWVPPPDPTPPPKPAWWYASDPDGGATADPSPPADAPGTAVPPVAPPATAPPATTADGLVRRVPGTHLTPALRRRAGAPGTPGTPPAPPAPGSSRDPERVRRMLSRFQANQRAGRAAAPAPPDGKEER
jgi:signal transduction histidine kinase